MPLDEELIYGLIPKIATLKLSTIPDEVTEINMESEELLDNLFRTFIIHILSKGGYDLIRLKSKDVFTSQFSEEDWIKNFGLNFDEPSCAYERFKKRLMGEISPDVPPPPHFENERGEFLRIRYVRDEQDYYPSITPFPNDIIVFDFKAHQRELRNPKHKENVLDAEKNNVRLMHIGELFAFAIPDRARREIILDNWKRIRDEAIADFLNEHSIVIIDLKNDELREAERHFQDADKKNVFEYYGDSIRDVGVALEILLKIMLFIKEGKEPRKDATLDYLINQLQHLVADESIFGENVLQDLKYITRLK